MISAAIGAILSLCFLITICIFLLSLWNKFIWQPLRYWFAYGTFYRRGLEKKYGKAVASYVVAHGRSISWAQKQVKRDEMEKIKEREAERRDFTARIDCPKCRTFDVHWMVRKRHGGVIRQCRNADCGHEWSQV